MVVVEDLGVVLSKTEREFECGGVLNPAVVDAGGVRHMFYRAVNSQGVSSIGYCRLEGGRVINRSEQPILGPEFVWESQGMEDPRITQFEGRYYMTYTAYDGDNAQIACAVSDDLVNFEKLGVVSSQITYQEVNEYFRKLNIDRRYEEYSSHYPNLRKEGALVWQKDGILFPQRIGGKMVLIHRIFPGIQIIFFDKWEDLTPDYWRNYFQNMDKFILMEPRFDFESRGVGGGCPPVKTDSGWILIYHALEALGEIKNRYHAGAALLDLENPLKVTGRLEQPLFSPAEEWEKTGTTSEVVFPTGSALEGKKLVIYYGAADSVIGAKSLDMDELIMELTK